MSRPYNALRRIVSLLTEVSGTLGIANGGTGSASASAARTALDLVKGTSPGQIPPMWALGRRAFQDVADNFSATTNPGPLDDASQGYTQGSLWYNHAMTGGTEAWVCQDATAGAAVWRSLSPYRRIGQSLGDLVHTDATASEATVWTLTIPSGFIRPQDSLRLRAKADMSALAVNRVIQFKLAGQATRVYYSSSSATALSVYLDESVDCRNSLTSQIAGNFTAVHSGATGNLIVTTADFATDVDITLRCQFGTAGAGANSITIRHAAVYLERGV